jgi:pimeloyl-ACP methyl ester carboxylesterase
MSGNPPHIGVATWESLLGSKPLLQEGLREVDALKVTINSADWQEVNAETAQRYGIEVVLMSGVGHFVMMEDPETFNRLLDEVVKKLVHSGSPR